ncbi:MAG: hypothetical protein JWP57_3173 [Spirosoma sp.]|nr:hypothetical protein [Spirosoma sp.]
MTVRWITKHRFAASGYLSHLLYLPELLLLLNINGAFSYGEFVIKQAIKQLYILSLAHYPAMIKR